MHKKGIYKGCDSSVTIRALRKLFLSLPWDVKVQEVTLKLGSEVQIEVCSCVVEKATYRKKKKALQRSGHRAW